MKLTLAQFAALEQPVTVTIHSLDQALYQMTASVDGKAALIVNDDGSTYRAHSLQKMRDALKLLPVSAATLRQVSAYDEMIGLPVREGSNALEIPLSVEPDVARQLH